MTATIADNSLNNFTRQQGWYLHILEMRKAANSKLDELALDQVIKLMDEVSKRHTEHQMIEVKAPEQYADDYPVKVHLMLTSPKGAQLATFNMTPEQHNYSSTSILKLGTLTIDVKYTDQTRLEIHANRRTF